MTSLKVSICDPKERGSRRLRVQFSWFSVCFFHSKCFVSGRFSWNSLSIFRRTSQSAVGGVSESCRHRAAKELMQSVKRGSDPRKTPLPAPVPRDQTKLTMRKQNALGDLPPVVPEMSLGTGSSPPISSLLSAKTLSQKTDDGISSYRSLVISWVVPEVLFFC